MNTSNPFIPQGSFLEERQRRRRERFKIGVFVFLAASAVLVAGLLIQGCQRDHTSSEISGGDATKPMPPPETNGPVVTEQKPETNSAVPPSPAATPTYPTPQPIANAQPSPARPATKDYAVVHGDSFHKVAKANGISLQALAEANPGVESARLRVGQVLQIPAGAETLNASSAPAPTPPTAVMAAASRPETLYAVKSGDTLSRIAKSHGTSGKALKAANGLKSDRIVTGRKLKIPEAEPPGASAPKD